MLVHKIFVKPCDEGSVTAAMTQIGLGHVYHNRIVGNQQLWYDRWTARTRLARDARQLVAKIRRCADPEKLEGLQRALRDALEERHQWPARVRKEDEQDLRRESQRLDRQHFAALGLHYGTYWLVEAAAKKAKHPHPQRVWDEGRAGATIPTSGPRKGVPTDDPHRPSLDITDGVARLNHGKGVVTRWSLHNRALRDRPLPVGGTIVQAWVQRRRTSTPLLRTPRYRWDLVLVIDGADPRTHETPADRIAAGLDIGWRFDDASEALRVGYVADDRGHHEAITMTARQFSRLQHAASVQAIADRECADPLRAELGMNERTGDRRIIDAAPEDPRAQQLIHLREWAHGQKRNALASRDQLYLREVHRLCRLYQTIYVERMKATETLTAKRKTARKKTGQEDAKAGVARGQRQLTAPFGFLRLLQREAPKFGTAVVEVDPAYTSRICTCGYDIGKASRERRCGGCGQLWDVDHLAATNLLRWGRNCERRSNDAPPGTARI